jgi:hypothetical protein
MTITQKTTRITLLSLGYGAMKDDESKIKAKQIPTATKLPNLNFSLFSNQFPTQST